MIENIVDVSRWQGNIDADVMLSKGINGMVIRLGSINSVTGIPYTDYLFYENVAKFAHEVPCGYYWYFRPCWSGKVQAEFVIDELQKEGINPNLPVFADVESNVKGVSSSLFEDRLNYFLATITRAGYNAGIYTRGYFWNDHIGLGAWAAEYPLWVARYHLTATHPWNNGFYSKLRPQPWFDYEMWQWSADGNGLGREYGCDCDSIDLNRANFETLEEYYSFANWRPQNVISPLNEKLDRIIEFIETQKE